MSKSMSTFREFYESVTVSVVEPIIIDKIGSALAKMDSGNSGFNVIHGTDITIDVINNTATFTSIDSKIHSLPIVGTASIRVSSNVLEERPVILLNIKLKDRVYRDVKFTVSDRTDSKYKVLIGYQFMSSIDDFSIKF